MPSHPVTRLLLLCLAILMACGTGDGDTSGAAEGIELNAIVQSWGPLPALSVEYTVSCVHHDASAMPDELRLEGNLEPLHARAAKLGMLDIESETWVAFLDLPPGSCSMQLRGRDDDGEVICTAELPFSVPANTVTQVSVLLECASPGFPLDREFNICPDLVALRCDELDPLTESTTCAVSFRDEDQTCGPGCDPQTCTVSPQGLSCTPGPDPGVWTIITCADAVLDCTGDGIADPFCTFDAEMPGIPSEGTDALVASFFVECLPPSSNGMPSVTATCTALTSDGDVDCDKTKLVTVSCPEPSP